MSFKRATTNRLPHFALVANSSQPHSTTKQNAGNGDYHANFEQLSNLSQSNSCLSLKENMVPSPSRGTHIAGKRSFFVQNTNN